MFGLEAMGLWALPVVGGPIVLALVIGYALVRQRRLTPAERDRRDRETRRLYTEER